MNPGKKPDKLLIVRNLAIGWLLVLGAFSWGALTITQEWWPYTAIKSLQAFVSGDKEEKISLTDKIKNDFGIKPSRHIVESQRQYAVPEHYQALEGLDLNPRRVPPLMHLAGNAPPAYRVIYGTFDFNDGLHGAVLLGPDGTLVNTWVMSQEDAAWADRDDQNVFPHGFEIFPDGSVVVAFDGGSSLTRYSYCGKELWRVKGLFHHSVSASDDGAVWTWGNPNGELKNGEFMVKVMVESGEIVESIHLDEVWPENPDIDPFATRQDDQPTGSIWSFDRWHVNDVEPLPERFAEAYEAFEAGDLLLSLRSINLVVVVDPATYAVKWWRQGLTRRQHDPDWNERGSITIFDNNMHRDFSRIYDVWPDTFESSIAVPGEDYGFYTWHRGKHDVIPGGGYMITSTEQGRAFEINAAGEIVFDFVNQFQKGGKFLALSEARHLPIDFFKELPECER
ncbi:MAG: hypothetical protein GQ538_07555 [Xanthomonadales bacterium]|nr:hypothetical protein [Xanthomonadales bacterium]